MVVVLDWVDTELLVVEVWVVVGDVLDWVDTELLVVGVWVVVDDGLDVVDELLTGYVG